MNIIVDGNKIEVDPNETILEVLKRKLIEIPYLCKHQDLCVSGSCRLCIVNVKNNNQYVSACSTKVFDGMELETSNSEIEKIRKINLELLFSQHKEECHDCVWYPGCKLLFLAKKYGVEINRFEDRKKKYPELSFGEIIDFDSSKCIDCQNCVEVCSSQGVSFLKMEEKDNQYEVSYNKDRACTYCGQCILHCPAGVFEGVGEFETVSNLIQKEKDKELIFQIAPSVRATIGEEFGFSPGEDFAGKIVAGLKKIGANKVYDVSVGADITTIEEVNEFIEKLENKKLPLFTSCCPAWVRYLEFYYPEYLENLTTVRSPQIILGGIIKEFSKNPKDVVVISVMPCVSKKYEITREELFYNGIKPVDYVLTTRELGRLFRNENIDFESLPAKDFDNLFGDSSGDAIFYGASGGVMLAAVRHAYYLLTGEVDNIEELTDTITIKEKEIKIKKVSGLGNAKKVLEELKENPKKYDYIEFMACPGGCIGGGGQPVPANKEIYKMRKDGLFKSKNKKSFRSVYQNKNLLDLYNKIKEKKGLLHTSYKQAEKESVDTKKIL